MHDRESGDVVAVEGADLGRLRARRHRVSRAVCIAECAPVTFARVDEDAPRLSAPEAEVVDRAAVKDLAVPRAQEAAPPHPPRAGRVDVDVPFARAFRALLAVGGLLRPARLL